MCGVAGVVGVRVDDSTLRRMADVQAHRGPDGSGTWRDPAGGAGLAHRRLSIVDLAGGAQPMANEDGTVVVSYNGEIYNHVEIRRDLEARGHRFATDHSDTEAIVHAYEEWGDACVERFRGIFAFGLWDARRRRLLLARDRLGVKPLYHAALPGGGLAFASEAKALLGPGLVAPRIDEDALDIHLALRYVPAPRTLFAGIGKLPPGHVGAWADGRLETHRYWNVVPTEDSTLSEAEAAEDLRARLRESVRLRLMSDVPLGIFLSGGVDSTAVAAIASDLRAAPVHTFHIDFEEAGYSEAPFARAAAGAGRTVHHETRLTQAGYLGWIDDLVLHMDEPVADPAAVPLRFVAALARAERHVVLLSGEGADEILGGYSYGRFPLYRRLAPVLRALPARSLLRLGYLGRDELRRLAVVREIAEVHSQTLPFVEEERRRLRPAADAGAAWRLLREIDAALPPGVSALGRILHMDTATWLPEDLLLKADKMTMAVGVELRVPFLDHELVEWAATLPPAFKHAGGVGKRVLKRALRGVVPDEILDRPKEGFPVPVSRWFREIPSWGDEVAAPDHPLAASGRVRRGAVRALVDLHRKGGVDVGNGLFTLLLIGRWMRRFGVE